ncbi:MAG: ABC transporter ATP-binding protein [Acidobacteria bacterium]|nr:ABC transporter ATP-binding protein [Acidobacteriota bacterium]MBI3656675.1 ABC transporter ATP-binding protein [Acidobacteriota bacterium]
MKIISLNNLSKKYPIYGKPSDKLKELLTLKRRAYHEEFWALRDVSIAIDSGSTVGIIGQNGSGKSTLLQLIAGILQPNGGELIVNGRVSALLELGAGFNPEFSGRENVFMNGAILGLTHRQMAARFDAIADFAEIGSFMAQPVKTYSSGMFMRLAFSVAIHVDPDILLVDEALAVGDLIFQHRCLHKINQLRDQGKTILFVTHDMSAVAKFCNRALLLDGGRLLEDGPPELVVQKYYAIVYARERQYKQIHTGSLAPCESVESSGPTEAISPIRTVPNVDHRFGNEEAVILGVELFGPYGEPAREVTAQQEGTLRISTLCRKPLSNPIVGFTLRDRLGIQVSASNTSYEGQALPAAEAGDIVTVDFQVTFPDMVPGSYSISPAIANGAPLDHEMCDWIDNALVFQLRNPNLVYGMLRLPIRTRFAIMRASAAVP